MLLDRIKETTTSTGTGDLTFGGAVTGARAFRTNETFLVNDPCYYVIYDPGTGDFEVGKGTVLSTALQRDTVLRSTNADALVNFAAGTKDIFCHLPADKALYVDVTNQTTITNSLIATLSLNTVGPWRFGDQWEQTVDGEIQVGKKRMFTEFPNVDAETRLVLINGKNGVNSSCAFFTDNSVQLPLCVGANVVLGGTSDPNVSGKINVWLGSGARWITIKNLHADNTFTVTQFWTQ